MNPNRMDCPDFFCLRLDYIPCGGMCQEENNIPPAGIFREFYRQLCQRFGPKIQPKKIVKALQKAAEKIAENAAEKNAGKMQKKPNKIRPENRPKNSCLMSVLRPAKITIQPFPSVKTLSFYNDFFFNADLTVPFGSRISSLTTHITSPRATTDRPRNVSLIISSSAGVK